METTQTIPLKELLAQEYIRQNPSATPGEIYLAGFEQALRLASQNVRVTVTDDYTGQVTETIGPEGQWDLADETYRIDVVTILQSGSESIDPNQPLNPLPNNG